MRDYSGRAPTPEEIAQVLAAMPLHDIPVAIAALAARLLIAPESESDVDPTRERYLSPDQITDEYGIDRRWVYAHAEQLGAVKLGRRTMRIPESGLRWYLEAHRAGRGGA